MYEVEQREIILCSLFRRKSSEIQRFWSGRIQKSGFFISADVAHLVLEAFEFKGNVVYLTDKADGQYKKTASNAKLRQHLPDFTFTPMNQAIKDTVRWFVDNFDQARK